MPIQKGAVKWYRQDAHWDKVKDGTDVVIAERQIGPVQVVMDEYYGRHVQEASLCSSDGLLEYWEILGRAVDPTIVSDISDTSYRSHINAVLVQSLDMATKEQLKAFLPPELGVDSIGRIFFTQ